MCWGRLLPLLLRMVYSPLHTPTATAQPCNRPRGAALLAAAALLYLTLLRPTTAQHHSTCELWSCDRPLVRSPTDTWPAPRPELDASATARWQKLHAMHLQEAKHSAQGARVVFIGDSITEGWLRTGLSARVESIPQPRCEAIWQQSFGRWRPLNFGVGGDRVQDLGWRLQHGLLASEALQPEVFVLLIGTNDLGNGESAEVTLAELTTLLQQLQAARSSASVLVLAVLPRGGDVGVPKTPGFHRAGWWDGARNNYFERIGQVNRGHRALAEAHGPRVRFLDCGPRLLRAATLPDSQLELLLANQSSGGSAAARRAPRRSPQYLPIEWMYDLLHLTPEGYRRWATCLTPVLAEMLDRGAGPDRPRRRVVERGEYAAGQEAVCIGRSCRGGADPGQVDLP